MFALVFSFYLQPLCTSFASGESSELDGSTSGGRGWIEPVGCRVSLDKLQRPPLPVFDRGNELELELCQAVAAGN